MKNRTIVAFRRRDYGLFLDLEGGGKVGVNPKTKEILFDEGPGEGALDGVVVPAGHFVEFVLDETLPGTWELSILLQDDWLHPIGVTGDLDVAARWVADATGAVGGKTMTMLYLPPIQPKGNRRSVPGVAFAGDPSFAKLKLSSTRPKIRTTRSEMAAGR